MSVAGQNIKIKSDSRVDNYIFVEITTSQKRHFIPSRAREMDGMVSL